MAHWKILKSKEMIKTPFFRMRMDECELPDGRVNPHYYVFEFREWVNVVPVTADGQMVLVEQYRHAGAEVFLEVPGGSTDAGDEKPALAGARELREETGYGAGEWIVCGHTYPNPALQTNRLHTLLALDCQNVGAQELDPFEDLTVRLMPVKDIYRMLDRGELKHALIVASLTLARPHLLDRGFL